MADFVEAAMLDQLPPGTSMMVKIDGRDVALFNVDGNIYAINDTCAHQGSSLAAGKLDDKVVQCRSHGWRYDVTTGYLSGAPGFGVASYPVRVVGAKILVGTSPMMKQ